MTEKELKKLSRSELLEMLIEQVNINRELTGKIAELEEKLSNYDYTMQNSGSIAEAALKLSGIFEAADKAVEEYKKAVYISTEKKVNEILGKAHEQKDK